MKKRWESRSLQQQIATIFAGLFIFSAGLIVFMTYTIFPRYYMDQKIKFLHMTVAKMNSVKSVEKDLPADFDEYCSTNNLEVAVTDRTLKLRYTNRDVDNGEVMASRLFVYLLGGREKDNEIISQGEDYILQKSCDPYAGINFLEIWGTLKDGKYYLVRTPVSGIDTAVSIANSFYLWIAVVATLFGTILVFWVTKKITRPITELSLLSEKMAALDFDVHYQGGSNRDLDCLGHNFNQMSETLEETISELKTANNELQKDIEKKTQIDEMRKEFLSNVTHELKTPLALIQGYAEGLKDNVNDDPDSRDFYCDVIIDEAVKMNNMVKKLLNLNQLEFGTEQVTMECFDLAAVIRGVLQSSHILIEQKEATVIFEENEPIPVWGDEFKAEEILTNYLTNALNHLDEKRMIEITCRAEEKVIRTTVFNTGKPIPTEDLDKIWIKFYKVDKARTREYGGNGIGLSIVKASVESMNQSCGVENYENGVAFWFTLEKK